MVIYKCAINLVYPTTIKTHLGAKAVAFQMQNNVPVVWLLLDETNALTEYVVTVVGTGHVFEADIGQYIGTTQDGAYVWHAFIK